MKKNKKIGQAGEDKVAETLKTIPDSRLMRNQYVPCGRGYTIEVDALLLTRKGIFVIEIKNIAGKIVGSYRLNEWTVHLKGKQGRKPARYKIYNPIKQNTRHVEAVARYLHVPPSSCTNLIVFTSRAELKKIPPNTKDFTITQENMLRSIMTRRLNGLSERFTDAELESMAKALERTTDVSDACKRVHILHTKQAERKRLVEREKRRAARKNPSWRP